MPAYDYRCSECSHHFQTRKSMAQIDTETCCPDCGSSETKRLISNVAIFSSSDGIKRSLAAAPSCSGCSMVGTGCAGCRAN